MNGWHYKVNKMKKISLLRLYEEIQSGTFQMYHGGGRWSTAPEIRPSKGGRYEGGVGIYFTNNYETARKYAKGGKVVQLVNIRSNFRKLKDVKLELSEIIQFITDLYGLRKKKEIISDLNRYSERTGRTEISLEILNNLIVNHEAGAGEVGTEIAKFFASKGADASVQDQSGDEQWLIVFNPKIIASYDVVDPKKVQDWMLPEIP